jgi:hypothetical protein
VSDHKSAKPLVALALAFSLVAGYGLYMHKNPVAGFGEKIDLSQQGTRAVPRR